MHVPLHVQVKIFSPAPTYNTVSSPLSIRSFHVHITSAATSPKKKYGLTFQHSDFNFVAVFNVLDKGIRNDNNTVLIVFIILHKNTQAEIGRVDLAY